MPGTPLRADARHGRPRCPTGRTGRTSSSGTGSARSPTSRDGRQRLFARSGAEITAAYPELGRRWRSRPATRCSTARWSCSDATGQPSFTALAERMHVRDPPPGRAARRPAVPVTYMIFDLLRLRRRGPDRPAVPGAAGRSWRGSGSAARGGRCRRRSPTGRPPTRPPGRTGWRAWSPSGCDVALPAGGALAGLGEGQARAHRRLRGRRLAAGRARASAALLVGVPGPDGRLIYRGRVGGGIGAATERQLLAAAGAAGRAERSPFADAVAARGCPGRASGYGPELVVEVRYGQPHPGRPAALPPVRCGCARTRAARSGRSTRCRLSGSGSRSRAGELELSNLDKVLYPAAGFTKGEVIDYYTRIAPVLLPHLRDRPLTRIRYPNGVDGARFFEKNTPGRHARLGAPGDAARAGLDEGPGDHRLSWSSTTCRRWSGWPTWPRWSCTPRSGGSARRAPPTCWWSTSTRARRPGCRVLRGGGADARPARRRRPRRRTRRPPARRACSCCCPICRHADRRRGQSAYAKRVAEELEQALPELIIAKMAKSLRPGKVFIDWSQNTRRRRRSRRTRCGPRRPDRLDAADLGRGGGECAGAGRAPVQRRRGAGAGREVRRPARPAARRRPEAAGLTGACARCRLPWCSACCGSPAPWCRLAGGAGSFGLRLPVR